MIASGLEKVIPALNVKEVDPWNESTKSLGVRNS